MHPIVTHLQTFLTALCIWRKVANLVEMRAYRVHIETKIAF